ncbi:MSHA biogenesis protein MshL [hydrothermal vent metagenome]|uniref:MSHA biogenesis protein MshL n=1 Tax=hydrothermal vent metagenome TaxID=652676 RepID=A0A1W1B938_9ZZZZ
MKMINRKLLGMVLSTSFALTQLYADCSYELFSISSTRDTKIIDLVEQLSDQCEFSIVITDPNAQKFLEKTLNKTHIKNLTLDEVLQLILTENNLAYQLKNNVLKISYLKTKTFEIDYTNSIRKGTGSTDITLSSQTSSSSSGGTSSSSDSGGGSQSGINTQSGIKIESSDEVKFWENLDSEIKNILNRPEDIYKAQAPIINRDAGLITVTATQKQIDRVEKYLKKLEKRMHAQVLIDVQIMSVTLNKAKTTGIDWSQLYKLQNIQASIHHISSKNVSQYNGGSITEIASGAGSTVSNLVSIQAGGSLNEVIKFLQTQGDLTAISNPKVLTLNNQPALITVGTEYFYKIKQATNQQGSGGGVVATTQNDSVQSVFAGVLLDITPEIADDGSITLKINPSLSQTRQDITQTSSQERTMPPDLDRRQLSSVVTVKDGSRIILGGLINTKTTIDANKVPILGDIPGLSYLFRYENKVKQVQELVIIIQPHIIQKDEKKLTLKDLGYEGFGNAVLYKNKKDLKTTKAKKAKIITEE